MSCIKNRRQFWRVWLLIFGIIGVAIYGTVVGAQSGGAQMWIAPAKLGLGTLLAMLICLPSLYISPASAGLMRSYAVFAARFSQPFCLSSILLIGFAPVAWIFSQSTDSIAFMGALHLLFWVIGIRFGLRLIDATGRFLGRAGQRSSQNLELHFYPGLFSDDNDVASDHCALENVFCRQRKSSFSRIGLIRLTENRNGRCHE